MFRLKVTEAGGGAVHALALRCQIRIEPQRRRYEPDEEERLYELFGDTPLWGSSLRPFLWTHVSTTLGGFTGETEFELPVECTYDFEVAGAKYLHALSDGEIPLLMLFSGTVFTRGESGFSAEPVSWDREASYRLPVSVWRDVMDMYFPEQCLGKSPARHPRRPAALQSGTGAADLGPGIRASPQECRRRTCEHRPDGPIRGCPECRRRGPLRRVMCSTRIALPLRKNQVRWQFGVLTPPAYSDVGPIRTVVDAH